MHWCKHCYLHGAFYLHRCFQTAPNPRISTGFFAGWVLFNQLGDVERCALRPGNVHRADGWRAGAGAGDRPLLPGCEAPLFSRRRGLLLSIEIPRLQFADVIRPRRNVQGRYRTDETIAW